MLHKSFFQFVLGLMLLSVSSGVFTSCTHKSPSDIPYDGYANDSILNSFVALGYISTSYIDSISEFQSNTNYSKKDSIKTYAKLFDAVNQYHVEKQEQKNIYTKRLQDMNDSIQIRFVNKNVQSFGSNYLLSQTYEIKNNYSKPISVIRAKVEYYNSNDNCFGGMYGNDNAGFQFLINIKPNQTQNYKYNGFVQNSVDQILKDIPNKDLKVKIEVNAVQFSDGTLIYAEEGLNRNMIFD